MVIIIDHDVYEFNGSGNSRARDFFEAKTKHGHLYYFYVILFIKYNYLSIFVL